jgi:mono/diheme cytochrome c family protein
MTTRSRSPFLRGAGAAAACVAVLLAFWSLGLGGAQDNPPARPPDEGPSRRVALPGTAGHGEDIYATRGCAACHATTFEQEAKDGLLRAGHPLEGAAHRGTWWNGRITTDAGDASEFCLRSFIDPNTEGFTPEERKALVLFMQELGSERGVSPLVLLRRDAGDVDLSSGDPGRGRQVWQRACLACHADTPPEVARLLKQLSAGQIAGIVRLGSGTMPFFQVDRLPAPMVADVVAYLDSRREKPSP